MEQNELFPEVAPVRRRDHSVAAQFLNRWSPRAYDAERPVAEADLLRVLEAARWAPSCFNEQPWRFLVARDKPALEAMHGCLTQSNQVWAGRAPVLIAILAEQQFRETGKANRWHSFDAGTAWGFMALQASLAGLAAHAMAGFDRQKLHDEFAVPDTFDILAVVALGYRGDSGTLPESLREREKPTQRKSLAEIWTENRMG